MNECKNCGGSGRSKGSPFLDCRECGKAAEYLGVMEWIKNGGMNGDAERGYLALYEFGKEAHRRAAPVAAAAPQGDPKQPIIGKLMDEISNLPVLWGLDEHGALLRNSDVFRVLVAVGKEYAAHPPADAAPASDVPEKAMFWFSCLTKCARLLNIPDDESIPSGVVAAVEKLVADAAPVDTKAESRNWIGDYAGGENQYECRCSTCGNSFFGHKHRVTCKVCAAQPSTAHGESPRQQAGELSPLYAWLCKTSKCGIEIVERAARELKEYYEGATPEFHANSMQICAYPNCTCIGGTTSTCAKSIAQRPTSAADEQRGMPTAYLAEDGLVCTHEVGECRLPIWLKDTADAEKFLNIMVNLVCTIRDRLQPGNATAAAPAVLTESQIDDLVFGYAPSCKIGEGRELVQAVLATATATDAWKSSGLDYDRAIHSNPDAKAWADLFVQTHPGLSDKHDVMLGWFANAMMAMHDHLKQQDAAASAEQARDAARLDWLEKMTVNVRIPLRYGSRDLFWTSPDDDDSDVGPSDIRAKIDIAIASQQKG